MQINTLLPQWYSGQDAYLLADQYFKRSLYQRDRRRLKLTTGENDLAKPLTGVVGVFVDFSNFENGTYT